MSRQFDSKNIRRELFGIFLDKELEITTDVFNEIMEEVIPLIEDVYYKGYEKGKVITEQTMREIEVDSEKVIEELTFEEHELFSSESEWVWYN